MSTGEEMEEVLMTALIFVPDKYGKYTPCRVLIDPASQAEMITTRFAERLGLQREDSTVEIFGVRQTRAGRSRGKISCTVFSRTSNHSLAVQLHVMDKITGSLPSVKCNNKWSHLEGLSMADPRWHEPGAVDMLLGVRYFDQILMFQRIRGLESDAPVAWETIFGWGVAGMCPAEKQGTYSSFHVKLDHTDAQLRKFWETEEPPKKRILTQEEKLVEEHFVSTYWRNESGRFNVRVPFDEGKKKCLGKSKDMAMKRLLSVERRLAKNPVLRQQYAEFMKEYEELGHMSRVPAAEAGERVGETNYFCHHFVTNEDSSTTKLRVVFDGSAATSTGVSLNDTMLVGATLQDDLYDLLIRFRIWSYVVKADVPKMFRQFLLALEDRKYHRILWRDPDTGEIVEYELNTVTYGTACATNLATRCMQQLGKDTATSHPQASKVLLGDTFVDDVMSGSFTPDNGIKLFTELMDAVATACLGLRKWTSNSNEIVSAIPEELRESKQLVFDDKELVKTLGVQWNPATDVVKFKTPDFQKGKCTKRALLSDLAKVFDPLGLICCVTLRGKFLLQELWKLAVGWDDEVSEQMQELWMEYKEDLSSLQHLTIPRRITVDGGATAERQGFCDSSEKGYGCVVYLRSVFPNGSVEVRFVTSKTRVAPVRQVTLPRLELCSAVLLAELIVHVRECLQQNYDLHLWSDSTIALTWIAASPRRWKTYFANRVATIQELTPVTAWSHVSGIENPADLASRGLSVKELLDCELWWQGPQWLATPQLPTFPLVKEELELEERKLIVTVATQTEELPALTRFSSLTKLKRVTGWYIMYLKHKIGKEIPRKILSASELYTALYFWVRRVQQQFFHEEY